MPSLYRDVKQWNPSRARGEYQEEAATSDISVVKQVMQQERQHALGGDSRSISGPASSASMGPAWNAAQTKNSQTAAVGVSPMATTARSSAPVRASAVCAPVPDSAVQSTETASRSVLWPDTETARENCEMTARPVEGQQFFGAQRRSTAYATAQYHSHFEKRREYLTCMARGTWRPVSQRAAEEKEEEWRDQPDDDKGEILVSLDTGTTCNLAKGDAQLENERTLSHSRQIVGALCGPSGQVNLNVVGERRLGAHVEDNVFKHAAIRSNLSALQPHTDTHGRAALFTQHAATVFQPKPGVTVQQIYNAMNVLADVVVVYPRRGNMWTWSSFDSDLKTMATRAAAGQAVAGQLSAVHRAHVLLGHLNYAKLKRIVQQHSDAAAFDDIRFNWTPDNMRTSFPCNACAATKIHDHPHAAISSRVPPKMPLEHLFIDLSGRLKLDSSTVTPELRALHRLFGEWEYYDLIVDGHTKYVFVNVTADKEGDSVNPWRITLIVREQRQRGTVCKRVFLDKGGENKDGEFGDFCRRQGIMIDWAPTNHKQRQGQVERYMLVVWQGGGTMLYHANLHVYFAAYAIPYAVYLLNRQPVKDDSTTRYERYHGVAPHFKNLFIFGSDAFVMHFRPATHKTEIKTNGKGEPAIFLGFSSQAEHVHVFLLVGALPGRVVESTRFRIFDGRFTFAREVYGQVRQQHIRSAASTHHKSSAAPPAPSAQQFDPVFEELDDGWYDATSVSEKQEEEKQLATPPAATQSHQSAASAALPVRSTSEPASSTSAVLTGSAATPAAPTAPPPPTRANSDSSASAPHHQHAEPQRRIERIRKQTVQPFGVSHYLNLAERMQLDTVEEHAQSIVIDTNVESAERFDVVNNIETCFLVLPGPASYAEYLRLPESERKLWDAARAKEDGSIAQKGVFEECVEDEVPQDLRIINLRYVFVIKVDDKGQRVYKARLVAKHIKGRNYGIELTADDTYAPVVMTKTFRIVLALAAMFRLKLHQFDINNAFLNAQYKRDNVYVRPPHGFYDRPGLIWRLKRPLYGMQDAPKEWYDCFCAFLLEQGFTQLKYIDPCFFFRHTPSGSIIMLIFHVDDNIGAVSTHNDDQTWWKNFVAAANARFGVKDLGTPQWCLGLNIAVQSGKTPSALNAQSTHAAAVNVDGAVNVFQETYIDKALQRFGLANEHSVQCPERTENNSMRNRAALVGEESRAKDALNRKQQGYTLELFQQYVGTLLYAAIMTRPDIAHLVQLLGRDLVEERLTVEHFEAAQRGLRYLKATPRHGLCYQPGVSADKPSRQGDLALKIEVFTDSDFAGDAASRSTTGYVIHINGNPIIWLSKQQPYVAPSTTAAEYIAQAQGLHDVYWIVDLLETLGYTVIKPAAFYGDNQSQIQIVQSGNASRLRGVRVSYHSVLEAQHNGDIAVRWIQGKDNVADIFTKSLPHARFVLLRDRLLTPAP